jgi:flagellar basal body-associated protein FliL
MKRLEMDQPEAVEVPNAPVAEKKGGSKIVLIVVTVVLVGGAAVAGAMFGPKLLHGAAGGHTPAPAAEEHAEGAEPAAEEPEGEGEDSAAEALPTGTPGATAQFAAIVVDMHTHEGDLHHLKVGLSFELAEKFTEDEFKRWTPRGRQAALAYLRTLEYEQATDAKRFDIVRKELCDKVKAAMGRGHVKRVLITDFVAQ